MVPNFRNPIRVHSVLQPPLRRLKSSSRKINERHAHLLTIIMSTRSTVSNFAIPSFGMDRRRSYVSNGGEIVENQLLVLCQNAPESNKGLGENTNKQASGVSDKWLP